MPVVEGHGLSQPYIVVLKEGPSHLLEDIQPHCAVLAQRFKGELWTYGGYSADLQIGSMRLRVVGPTSQNRFIQYLALHRALMRRAKTIGTEVQGRIVVVSYDPFKTGLLAKRFAKAVDGLFVCEVNGAYGDPDTFADIKSVLWRNARLLQMRLLGAYVLRCADGIKLLFDDQLKGFVTPRKPVLVRRFFDIAYLDRFHTGTEEPIILLVGYPFYRKGADVLFHAFVSIAARNPSWRLVLIGHQLNENFDRLRLRHPQVDVYAGMPQTQLVEWVARSSIVAQPSRSEAMGRVLLEAAAAGKCRVGTVVNGIPTVICDNVDGVLVPKNDVQALARALESLMNNSGLRARLAAKAKMRSEREFTAKAYLDNYEELFESLIEVANSRPAG